jgi:hypothetical protein
LSRRRSRSRPSCIGCVRGLGRVLTYPVGSHPGQVLTHPVSAPTVPNAAGRREGCRVHCCAAQAHADVAALTTALQVRNPRVPRRRRSRVRIRVGRYGSGLRLPVRISPAVTGGAAQRGASRGDQRRGGASPLVACCTVSVACCVLRAACCALRAARGRFARCLLSAVCCMFAAVSGSCALSVACCLLPVACCVLLHVACCLLHVACCMLPVACCLLCSRPRVVQVRAHFDLMDERARVRLSK